MVNVDRLSLIVYKRDDALVSVIGRIGLVRSRYLGLSKRRTSCDRATLPCSFERSWYSASSVTGCVQANPNQRRYRMT